jgi:hypothetical protein
MPKSYVLHQSAKIQCELVRPSSLSVVHSSRAAVSISTVSHQHVTISYRSRNLSASKSYNKPWLRLLWAIGYFPGFLLQASVQM